MLIITPKHPFMSDQIQILTDTAIIYKPVSQRYAVLAEWAYDAPVEGARFGMVYLYLCTDCLVFEETDDHPLYGGGYPKRNVVQPLADYRLHGPARWISEKVEQALSLQLS
jgi:hypothetical protein